MIVSGVGRSTSAYKRLYTLGHAMDRIVNEFANLKEVMRGMYEGHLRDALFSTSRFREKLQVICEEKVVVHRRETVFF